MSEYLQQQQQQQRYPTPTASLKSEIAAKKKKMLGCGLFFQGDQILGAKLATGVGIIQCRRCLPSVDTLIAFNSGPRERKQAKNFSEDGAKTKD